MIHTRKIPRGPKVPKCFILSLFCICTLQWQFAVPLRAQTDSTNTDKKIIIKETYPDKLCGRQTWEKIVSFPGALVFFPVKMVFNGIGTTGGLVYKSKIIDRIQDILTFDNEQIKIRPMYSSRSGAGLKFYQKNLINEGSRLGIYTAMWLRSRQDHKFAFEGIHLFRRSIRSDFFIRYRQLPDERFYGFGPESKKDNISNYAFEQTHIQIKLHTELSQKIHLGVLLNLEQNNIHGGKAPSVPSTTDLYKSEHLPGMETNVKMFGSTIEWRYDTRNSRGGPTCGKEILLGSRFYTQLPHTKYGFYKIFFDINQYIHLFYERNLVLRIAGEITEPFDNRTVPFYYMSELGRQETIRGYSRGRFRDLDMILGSIEYRCPILRSRDTKAAAFLFADMGQVTDQINTVFDSGSFRYGFGGGIRIWSLEDDATVFMIGKSKEQIRVYFVLNQ